MTTDYIGAKIRYNDALRRNYLHVDQSKCRRIARQLIEGKHVETYGVESARTVVMNAANQVMRAVVVRPSARLVKHQKANSTVVNKQSQVINAIAKADTLASGLHTLHRRITMLQDLLVMASSAKQRRSIKQRIHETKIQAGLK